MKLNVTQAAESAGVNRSTIQRYIKSGKLSATPSNDGKKLIDPAELERVFGEIAAPQEVPKSVAEQHAATVGVVQVLELQNNDLREQINVLRHERDHDRRQHEGTVEDLRKDRDAWRNQAEKQQTLLLTHAQEESTPRTGFWKRLFGV